ncbi:MAG: hypothetical protein JEZ08_25250 [Clostridiales bacterium]|nr:hypothetical protein [Clostridiales bacterium]
MNNRIKAYLSIWLMATTLFLSMDSKYSRALGDYVLEFLGIRSWTGDYTGLHLTVIYCGVLFCISILLVKKYAVNQGEIKTRKIFIIVIVLLICFSFITNTTAQYIKRNSEGLSAIAYEYEDSEITYNYSESKLKEFEAIFTLRNYAEERQIFSVSIDSRWLRKDDIDKISILNSDGTLALFILEAGESKTFSLSHDKYTISGGRTFRDGGSSGDIQELILSSYDGKSVKLLDDSFHGFVISK